MPNTNKRESKQALDSLKALFKKILIPITVYRCVVCSMSAEDQEEIISHMIERHPLNEIYTILDFDSAFREPDC